MSGLMKLLNELKVRINIADTPEKLKKLVTEIEQIEKDIGDKEDAEIRKNK